MTFQEFQQRCNQAKSTNQAVVLPCPVVIGEGDICAGIGDTFDHYLVIFKTPPNNAALLDIYKAVQFRFDAPNNQTVIKPLTTA